MIASPGFMYLEVPGSEFWLDPDKVTPFGAFYLSKVANYWSGLIKEIVTKRIHGRISINTRFSHAY